MIDHDDEKQVGRAQSRHRKRRQVELDDLKQVLNTPSGRRFITRLLDQTGLLASDMFTGNSTTFYNLGKRDVGLWVYNEIMKAKPESMIEIMNDRLTEKQ
ncbi:MAG: hypothetical protein ACPGQI_10830 [Gammaproteobacteria bacterium]